MHLGDELIGPISRDGTAIETRECPARQTEPKSTTPPALIVLPEMTVPAAPTTAHPTMRKQSHVPLIAHNPRGDEKREFDSAEAVRYREPTVAERVSARLKDKFGGRTIRVGGDIKVMSHLMFGVRVRAYGSVDAMTAMTRVRYPFAKPTPTVTRQRLGSALPATRRIR